MTVLDDLNKGVYQRTMVNKNLDNPDKPNLNNQIVQNSLKPNFGKIVYQDNIIK